jgi:hypothetical protein
VVSFAKPYSRGGGLPAKKKVTISYTQAAPKDIKKAQAKARLPRMGTIKELSPLAKFFEDHLVDGIHPYDILMMYQENACDHKFRLVAITNRARPISKEIVRCNIYSCSECGLQKAKLGASL